MIYLGIAFSGVGLWWHINNCIRYIRSLRNENDEKSKRQQIKFEGSTTYPCFWLPFKSFRRWPIESILKILIPTVDIIIKIHDWYKSREIAGLGALLAVHIPLTLGFFLAGCVEMLVHYKFPLPKRITHVLAVIAFAMEGFTLFFHIHGEDLLEAHIHRLAFLTITCSVIFAIGECFYPNNFSFIVGRSFFALTQGTWFIQAANIVWPLTTNAHSTWDHNSHDSILYTTTFYTFHITGNVIILIVLYLVIHKSISRSIKLNFNQIEDDNQIDGYKLIPNGNDEDNEP